DPQGRIRLQLFSTSGLTGSQAQYSLLPVASTARPFEITGVVGVVSPTSVTINGTTIPLAAALPAEVIVDPTNVVRISGTLDSSNRLTGSLVTPTYTTIAFPRLAPTSLLSIGVGLTGDVNAFDADGPIAGSVFIYNPLGSAAGQFLCDQSVERLVLDGQAALFFAPNFSMIQQIPTFAPAEFTFQRDQFGLIVAGSKK
ncbi:MAG: hypothetical protein ABI977_12035, partial [Acidobacteriota bacterium]